MIRIDAAERPSIMIKSRSTNPVVPMPVDIDVPFMRLAVNALLALAIVSGSALAADEPVDVPVTVQAGGAEPSDAYVALIALNCPLARPTAEAVLPRGNGVFRLVPGTYRAIVGARGFEDLTRNVSVAAGRPLRFELAANPTTSGRVTALDGAPVPHARVYQARTAMQPPSYSELALRYFRPQWSTSTDDRGEWVLPLSRRGALPVVVEAAGFSPAIETLSTATPAPTVVLTRGASLRATVDRTDPHFIVSLLAEESDAKDPASQWLPQVLARSAEKSSLEWNSLRPGRYRVVGRDLDPLKFAAVAELGHVTLGEDERATLQLKLPPPGRREAAAAVLFVSGKSPADLRALDAFATTDGGGAADWVQHFVERTPDGTLVYLRTRALPRDLVVLTPSEVIAPADVQPASKDEPVRTVISGRATMMVHLAAPAEGAFSPTATARFGACERAESMRFGVTVSRKGDVELPFPALCHALTLEMPPFEPVVIEAHLGGGETRSFGPFALKVGAAAEVHAVNDPSGAAAAGAVVRVMRASGAGPVVVAEGVTNQSGRVRLPGLPADQEITIEARDPATRLSGAVTLRLDRGKVATVDPLKIPVPARLAVSAHLAPRFRERFPEAKIRAIGVEPSRNDMSEVRRTAELTTEKEILFEGLRPGSWHLLALVDAAGSIQPVPVQDVELHPGEERRLTPDVDPAVFEGRVLEAGEGIEASVGVGDPPSSASLMRFARSGVDGRFTIVLPGPGTYNVQVSPVAQQGEPIELGEVAFSDPEVPILLTLPQGALVIHVKDGGRAAAGVPVLARLRSMSATRGIAEAMRNGSTDAAGTVRFESLPAGRWFVEARRQQMIARSAAEVGSAEPASVELNLAPAATIAGFVHDAVGAPVSAAQVDCFFLGPGAVPQSVRATTDTTGAFTADLALPLPNMLDCGVTTADGAIAAWTTPPTTSADFVLPAETAPLVIRDWGTRISRDVFWLVSADGRMFDLSWAAAKIGKLWTPLTISRAPAGSWRIVRADSIDRWFTLATNGGNALSAVSEFRLQPGKSMTLDVYPKALEH